ncbi:DNA polymerase mu [Amanita muscaria]
MSSKRPRPSPSPSPTPRKHQRSHSTESAASSAFAPIKIYIVQAKLDPPTVSELFSLVESRSNDPECFRLELCSDASDADIIVTAVRMKKRLERHIDWNVARQKAVVTPDWLRHSVKESRSIPCRDYAALKELQGETAHLCPDSDHLSSLSPTPEKSRLFEPTSEKVKANYASRYACCRASPLVSPNQALLEELSVLERHRELEGKSVNALSYARAISVLKAYPRSITPDNFRKEVQNLPHLGDKMKYKIKEFIKNGFIEESRTIRASTKYQALSAFVSVHGVGPSTAQKLYELGIRTFEEMERYYDIHRDDATNLASIDEPIYTPNGKLVPRRKTKMPDISVKVGLLLREEFATPISSDEVEEIHRVVTKELDQIQSGCVSTIVGGCVCCELSSGMWLKYRQCVRYRRGKAFSNDVDIVFSHPDQQRGAEIMKGLCQKLTFRLYKSGLITHVMNLSSFHSHDALRQGHSDSLEKTLTVFILPDDGQRKRVHRRLDLIFASPDTYWTAVIGWSGSKMFERDLRLWAKVEKGMKFDSTGLTRRHDSKLLIPKNEKEVFDILGLEWVDPTMRNADI